MRKYLLVLMILPLLNLVANAQSESEKAGEAMRTINNGIYLGTFQPEDGDPALMPEFQMIRNKINKSQDQEGLQKYKDSLNKLKVAYGLVDGQTANKTANALDPFKTLGFDALGSQGTPSDNTIAVGKNGKMIAAVNSSLRVYNTDGSVVPGQGVRVFPLFWNDATAKTDLCDPLVHYDTDYDRFIVFTQICDRSTFDNRILVAFSTTNDPAGPYHYYAFRSNLREVIGAAYPVDVWFDYPKMGVSASDLFITGNLFRNTSSTTSSYEESAVFQIDKGACFAGNVNPNAVVFNDLTSNPFTLVPASHGMDDNYGNEMHMFATVNRNTSQTIRAYTVTGRVTGNPTIALTNITIPVYSQPADGVQPNTNVLLNTGDNRGMSAMYVDGWAHFVFHCNGPGNYSAINYSRFQRANNAWVQVQNKIISSPGIDYGFPSIASMGHSFAEQSAMIVFNYSSLTLPAGIGAVYSDHLHDISNGIILDAGTDFVSLGVSNGTTRWGDYTGISREHNAPTPTVWGFGMSGNSSNRWTNHISRIEGGSGPLDTKELKNETGKVKVYPNPVVDIWTIELDLEEQGALAVYVYDMQGKKVRDVYERTVRVGESIFSFNKNGLTNGTYMVRITLNNKIVSNEKIVVAK